MLILGRAFILPQSKNKPKLEFNGYTGEWLDFITACRNLNDTSTYNLIIGGVATKM